MPLTLTLDEANAKVSDGAPKTLSLEEADALAADSGSPSSPTPVQEPASQALEQTSTLAQLPSVLFGQTPESTANAQAVTAARNQLGTAQSVELANQISDKWSKIIAMAQESSPENVPMFEAQRDAELRSVGSEPMNAGQVTTPKTTPEDITTLTGIKGRPAKILSAAASDSSSIAEGFLQPEGALMFVPGGAAAFVAQMASSVPADLGKAAGHYSAGDVESGDSALINAAVTAGMLVLPSKLAKSKDVTLDDVVGPKQAADIRDQFQGPIATGEVLNTPKGATPQGEANAGEITSPTSVPQPEVRPPVGQTPPLRQQGEVAGTRPAEEAQGNGVPQEVAPTPEPAKLPPLPKGDTLVTVQKADGTTYEASTSGKVWPGAGANGEDVPAIARANPGDEAWSHGMLAPDEKIIPTPPKPTDYSAIGKDMGFAFDGTHEYPGVKPLLSFTFKDVPKTDPVYGATFNLPIDATPEQITARARAVAEDFRGKSTPETPTAVEPPKTVPAAASESPAPEQSSSPNAAAPVSEKPPSISDKKTTPISMGGATPEEFQKNAESPTAMKYRLIDQERQQRGLPPLAKGETISDQATMDKTMAKLDQDPEYADKLISDINEGRKKVVEDWENHILLLRKIDLRNEYAKSARDAAQAYEDGRTEDLPHINARTQAWSDALTQVEKASRLSGSARGRALRSLRVMANEDFSLASLEMQKRAARGGAPITALERAGLEKIANDYKAKADALEAQLAKGNADAQTKALKDALDKVEREARQSTQYHPKVIEMAENYAKKWDERGRLALQDLKSFFGGEGQMFSGPLNPEMFDKAVVYGTSKLVRGAVDLAKWTDAMVKDLGDKFRPYADAVFKASLKSLDDDLKRVPKQVAAKVKATADEFTNIRNKINSRLTANKDISSLVQRVARIFVQSGIKDRELLIDKVHEFLKDSIPDATRSDTMRAIAGYGDFKPLSKDEITVQLRGMKGEMQQLAKLEDMALGKSPLKSGVERRTPTEAERQLIKKVNEAKYAFQVPMTDPATQLKSALDTYKTNLKNRIADYEDRIKRQDYSRKPRRELQLDQAALKIRHEMEVIRRTFHENLLKDKLANQSGWQRAGQFLGEIINTTRALKASVDLSATLRQGGIISFSHPIRSAKIMPDQLKALASPAEQYRVEQEILARPNYRLYDRSGLSLTEHGQKLSQMEEAYMSRWADKIPGVAASQRAYTVFLNKLRADSFDAMADWVTHKGKNELTPDEGKIIANYINVATGRGNFGMKENALVGLNTAFFAPRFNASRFQYLLGQPIYHGLLSGKTSLKNTARVRSLVAGEYARFAIGVGVIYTLAHMAGFQVETDPRSSDFGKIKIGKTRLDPMAGLIQSTVLLSRIASGKTKTMGGRVVPIRGDKVPYGTGNTADVIARFLRTKLSPVFGTSLDVATGKDVVGQPVTPATVGAGLVIPLSIADIYQTMKEQGVPAGSALSILGLLGVGLQTYTNQKSGFVKIPGY